MQLLLPFQSLIHHMGLGIQCILLDFHKSLGNKAQMLVENQLQFLQSLLTEDITIIYLLITILSQKETSNIGIKSIRRNVRY